MFKFQTPVNSGAKNQAPSVLHVLTLTALVALATLRCAPPTHAEAGPEALKLSAGSRATAAHFAPQDRVAAPFGPRVSRGFFERLLTGTVEVRRVGSLPAERPVYQGYRGTSPISWQEFPSSDPAPKGDYLADFRDHTGCANYRELGGMQLCFNILGDVSNLGLNAQELSVRGMDRFIEQGLPECGNSPLQELHFVSATRDSRKVTVTYTATRGDCALSFTVGLIQS